MVLCASGTAVSGDLNQMLDLESHGGIFGPPFLVNQQQNQQRTAKHQHSSRTRLSSGHSPTEATQQQQPLSEESGSCSLVHVPYVACSLPYACKISRCGVCHKGWVPDALFSTIEPPPDLAG